MEDTVELFKLFVGPREKKGTFKLYSDMGRELIAAARGFHILRQHGRPGVRKSNAVIEQANRGILARARTALDAVGLP
eukprot:9305908-Lingulodinium_polyedra.AAC.1